LHRRLDSGKSRTMPYDKSRRPQPFGNPGIWVNTNDYPSLSLRNEEEGTTSFRLTIGPNGRVDACEVTWSSGFEQLDIATCRNITRRARFYPALDSNGNPTVGTYGNRVTWRIPAVPSYARQTDFEPLGPQATFGTFIELADGDYPQEALEKGMRGYAEIILTISESGAVTACTVQEGTGHPLLDSKTCEIAKRWTFVPAHDANGKAVSGTTKHLFSWILPDEWKKRASNADVLPGRPIEYP
jgi:TonB family protein